MTNCFSTHERVILVFVNRVQTLFYFLHDITNPWMMIKIMLFTHRPCVSLPQFSFCRWHHNWLLMRSQWQDNCDAITWLVISNSLDIDFIYGDIHGWSCKNYTIVRFCWGAMLVYWPDCNASGGCHSQQLLAVTATRGFAGGTIYQRGAWTKSSYYHYYHSLCIIGL